MGLRTLVAHVPYIEYAIRGVGELRGFERVECPGGPSCSMLGAYHVVHPCKVNAAGVSSVISEQHHHQESGTTTDTEWSNHRSRRQVSNHVNRKR